MKKVLLYFMCTGLLACSIYYQPNHKGQKPGHDRGGILIEIPQKKPEVKPIPES